MHQLNEENLQLRKLPLFLKAEECILLIKYDGEREHKKYTIRIIYNIHKNFYRGSLGKDTDTPFQVLTDIAEHEKSFPLEEANAVLHMLMNQFIDISIEKYGEQCIALVKLEEKEHNINYTFHIIRNKKSVTVSGLNISEALEKIFNDKHEEKPFFKKT